MRKPEPLVFLAVMFVAAGMQWASGAYTNDFDQHPDEPAHVVSSLMVRDYIAHGIPQNPLTFARNYYDHFPKVAIGHWPPLFHTTEAIWMLIFGRTKAALISWLAVLAASAATLLFWWTRRECGMVPACFAVVAFTASALVQRSLTTVMVELMLGFLAFAAAISWGFFLQSGKKRDAAWFALFAAAALATHGRAVPVALLIIPTGALLARRGEWRWIAALITMAGVFTLPSLLKVVLPLSLASPFKTAWVIASHTTTLMGWPVVVLAVIGGVSIFRNRRIEVQWIPLLGLIVVEFLFHSLANWTFEDRYLVTYAPVVAALSAAGCRACFKKSLPVFLCALAAIAFDLPYYLKKPDLGYHVFASTAAAENPLKSLIAGDATHEGAYIAEMDLRDPLLTHTVLRGSKVLASSTWWGSRYKMRFKTPAEVSGWLDGTDVSLVIVQTKGRPHVPQLIEALTSDRDHWHELDKGSFPLDVRLFERSRP